MAFTILDKHGGKTELTDSAAKTALANGADQEIRYVDETGKYVGKAPASLVKRYAQEKGYFPETPEQRELNERVESEASESGAFGAFKSELFNQALFGAPDIAKSYTDDELNKRVREKVYEDNPWSRFAGGALGAIGSTAATMGAGNLLRTGSVLGRGALEAGGQVAARSVAREALAAGGRVAAESAVMAAPSAAVQAFYGDYEHAAENLALSTGAGFVLGGAGSLIGSGVKAGSRALSERLPRMENEQLVKSMFRGQSKKDMKAILNAASKEEGALEGAGIDQIGEQLKRSGIEPKPFEEYLEWLARSEAKTNEVGKAIGDRMLVSGELPSLEPKAIINHLDDAIGKLKDNPLAREEEKILRGLKRDFESKWLEKQATALDDEFGLVTKAANDAPIYKKSTLSLEETWNLQKQLDDQIYKEGQTPGRIFSKAPTVREKALLDIRKILKSNIDETLEKADGEAFREIQDLRKQYQNLKIINKVGNNQAQTLSNRNFSMSDNQWGTAGNIAGAVIGGATGGGLGAAIGGQAMGLAQSVGHKLIRENGNAVAAKGLHWLNEMTARAAEGEYDRIPKLLSGFGKASKLVKPLLASKLGTFSSLSGDDTIKDDEAGFKKFSQAVVANQMQPNSKTQDIAAAIAKQNPQVAQAYTAQANKVQSYLYAQLPKNPLLAIPFANPDNWKPTKAQIKSYQAKASIVADPFSILARLQDGTINKDHIAALKSLYPSIAGRVTEAIKAYGMANPQMPYQKKLLLSQLIGEPLDASLQYVESNQAAYAQQAKQEQLAKTAITDTPGTEFTEQQKTEAGLPA